MRSVGSAAQRDQTALETMIPRLALWVVEMASPQLALWVVEMASPQLAPGGVARLALGGVAHAVHWAARRAALGQ